MSWDQEDIQYQPASQWCEDENCDGSCGSDHSNEVSSDAEEADPNGDQGMAEPLNEEDWDEMWAEEVEAVAEMQELLLMEDNSSEEAEWEVHWLRDQSRSG